MSKLALPLVVLCLLCLGCSDDSPSDPADALVFQGTLMAEGRQRHDLSLPDSRVARIVLTEVEGRLIQVIPGFDPAITIAFGLGRPDANGECVTSFSAAVREGSLFVFGLEAVDYCLVIFDSGTLPDDAIVDYTLTVTLE